MTPIRASELYSSPYVIFSFVVRWYLWCDMYGICLEGPSFFSASNPKTNLWFMEKIISVHRLV